MPLPSPFLFLSFFFLFFRAVSAGGWHAIKASGTVLVTGHGTKRATMPSLCISSKGSPRSLSWKRWQKPVRGWKKSSWGTYAGRKANPPSLSLSLVPFFFVFVKPFWIARIYRFRLTCSSFFPLLLLLPPLLSILCPSLPYPSFVRFVRIKGGEIWIGLQLAIFSYRRKSSI